MRDMGLGKAKAHMVEHRLERVLDHSTDKKNVVARASYITCENRKSDIVHLSHLFKFNRA